MQREEGFNTKMADGPDEYDTEAACVPLLHPEVRNRAERIPRSEAPGTFVSRTCGGRWHTCVEQRNVLKLGRARRQIQARARLLADNGGGDSGAGRAGAGSGTQSLAVRGRRR